MNIAVIHTTVKLKPEKNSGLNGIQTHDLSDTGAKLRQLAIKPYGTWSLCRYIFHIFTCVLHHLRVYFMYSLVILDLFSSSYFKKTNVPSKHTVIPKPRAWDQVVYFTSYNAYSTKMIHFNYSLLNKLKLEAQSQGEMCDVRR